MDKLWTHDVKPYLTGDVKSGIDQNTNWTGGESHRFAPFIGIYNLQFLRVHTRHVLNKREIALYFNCTVPSEGSSKKSQFWWDNIVMGTSSSKKPLLTELWDKPFAKSPVTPSTSM